MHDPRTSTALRRLAELTAEPPPPRWSWSVGVVDPEGRLTLPPDAALAVGAGPLALTWQRVAALLRPDDTGAVTLDGRRRLLLPAALRRAERCLIGVDAGAPLVVVAPTTALDAFGDVLAGPRR